MKTPPFSRISQSDCNAEQCELFRTKNKRSQSIPVDGGPLTALKTRADFALDTRCLKGTMPRSLSKASDGASQGASAIIQAVRF